MTHLLTHLRHVDLAVPDFDQQQDFYSGLWGLTEVASDSGISFLAAEGSPEQYIVRVRKNDEKRLDLVSFGAATAQRPPVARSERQRPTHCDPQTCQARSCRCTRRTWSRPRHTCRRGRACTTR